MVSTILSNAIEEIIIFFPTGKQSTVPISLSLDNPHQRTFLTLSGYLETLTFPSYYVKGTLGFLYFVERNKGHFCNEVHLLRSQSSFSAPDSKPGPRAGHMSKVTEVEPCGQVLWYPEPSGALSAWESRQKDYFNL